MFSIFSTLIPYAKNPIETFNVNDMPNEEYNSLFWERPTSVTRIKMDNKVATAA